MATIANQIKRILDASELLNKKGRGLGLIVPDGKYWDNNSKDYISYNAAALQESDQIDKIAAAFNNIVPKLGTEIKVPITVTTDGTTTTVESYTLDTGYYVNATIVPYIKVEEVDDIVINVEMIVGRVIDQKSTTILPSNGFNYIGQFNYTVTEGALSNTHAGYDNNTVNVKVDKSGWLDKDTIKAITVDTSELKYKVGENGTDTVISDKGEIRAQSNADTYLTIGKGIYGSNRTITIKSLSSQTSGDAGAEHILEGKKAWINGVEVTGTMPNYSGTDSNSITTTLAEGITKVGNYLALIPKLGYYNNYSNIVTDIVYRTSRTLDTTDNSATDTDVLISPVYYETIPAGYYASEIKRKLEIRQAVLKGEVDYTDNKVIITPNISGWFGSTFEVSIDAGPALYQQTEEDLKATNHRYTILPIMDADGTKNNYLTEVTIDNTKLFELLAAI